jgi:hypothetical protein
MRTLSWHKKSSAYHTVVLETENMNNRPITTLFMLASLDGKISTGYVDTLDVDPDFPRIVGVKEGLHHYYDLE